MPLSMRDAPGTQREYETIFIVRPDTSHEGILGVNNRIKGVIEDRRGKLLRVDNWGKRKLAYEVRKQLKGIYLYWRYLGTTGVVEEVERNLRMLDAVIRYYTVLIDQDIDPDARPSEVTDESFEQAATTGPDEEEIMIGLAATRGYASEGESPAAASDDAASEADRGGEGKEAAATEAAPASEGAEAAATEAAPVSEGAEAAATAAAPATETEAAAAPETAPATEDAPAAPTSEAAPAAEAPTEEDTPCEPDAG